MSLVTFTIPNLTNGVSQQPVTVRLPNQGQEQINSNCRITDGLSKRSPTNLIDLEQLMDLEEEPAPLSLLDSNLAFHKVAGEDAEGNRILVEMIVKCDTGTVWLRYLEGPRTGNTYRIDDFPYLISGKKNDIKFLTTGDTTYVLNKTITVANTTETENPAAAENMQGSLVYIQQGFFGTLYRIRVRLITISSGASVTTTATHSTADSTTTNVSSLQTSSIRTSLQSALEAALTSAGGTLASHIDVDGSDNWIQVELSNSVYSTTHRIECEVFSSTARTAIYAFNGIATDVSVLPQTAPNGYTMRVAVGSEDLSDDYYLKYNRKENAWIESKRLGLVNFIDNETMPLSFVNMLSDYDELVVDHIDILDRTVGDLESNKDPSFVGHTLNDMFIFYNRLGFLSRNNVVLSRIDEYNNFYKTTCATNLVSDRVDVTASVPSTRYSEINFAIPFDKELVLFGEAAQYSLAANTGFDVRTANLSTLTEYESDKDVSPLNIGSSIYFPIVRGAYTAIFDLARRGDMGLTAEEITQHVPVYIKGDIVEMVHSATENMVFLRTIEEKRTIYVQNRFVRDSVLQQNAWHKWILPNDVVNIQIIGSRLYINMVSEDGLTLIRTYVDISLTLIQQSNTTQIDFLPFIDKQVFLESESTVSTTDRDADYFVLPEDEDRLIGVGLDGFSYIGLERILEALEDQDLWVGVMYTFSYTFSQQVPAMYNEDGKTAMQYAKLNIQSMKLSYVNSGKFEIIVSSRGRPDHISRFSGVLLGSSLAILGRVNINTGVFKFPVHARSESVTIRIESDQPYPVTFNTCELQGKLINNSGRM